MDPFQYIGRYFWVICLAITLINYLIAGHRAKLNIGGIPENIALAQRYRHTFAIFSTTPWLIMGIGQLVGSTPSMWYYFRPQDGNPYVIAWVGLIFLQAIVFAIWVFAADGARKVREYDLMSVMGMRTKKPMPEILIKLMAAVGPAFALLWVYLVISSNVPIPR